MLQTDVAQAGRFTSKSAGHYNRLTLRNGVSLNGLTRNPLDLEIFFQTALFFVSRAARESVLGQETFLARLEYFRSHHAAWLAGTTEEIYEWMQGCGLVVLTDDKVRFTAPESSEFESTDEVLAYWQELEGERVKRRHRVRAQLQAKNREVNAPKTISTDPELDRRLMQEALRMAQLAYDNDEVPVGAVIAMDGNIVAAAMNEVVTRHDPTAHAEVLVIRKAAALLGAPVGHDFCVLSLSDLLTPWEVIERRIRAAAEADFVTAVYNPRSEGRYWQLHRLREIFLEARDGATPVGYVKQAGRSGEEVAVTTLAAFDPEQVDMFTVVLIGNSESYTWEGKIITPRGYFTEREEGRKVGQEIMSRSFQRIMSELRYPVEDRARLWVLLHAIHTTADFTMEEVLSVEPGSVEKMYGALSEGRVRTIVTDVTMAASGIRKGALERLGIEVKCYLNDPRAVELAQKEGMTRAAAGFRIAVAEHPDALYVVGNAPTALMELCSLMRRGKAAPLGVVGAPVGFVHVRESKYMLQSFTGLPKVVVEGRKGGSNVAATIVNAILCYDDAARLLPGRDV